MTLVIPCDEYDEARRSKDTVFSVRSQERQVSEASVRKSMSGNQIQRTAGFMRRRTAPRLMIPKAEREKAGGLFAGAPWRMT